MSAGLRILIITNEAELGDAEGQFDGYRLLVEEGEIDSCIRISHKTGSKEKAYEEVVEVLGGRSFDLILIWSPTSFPSSEQEFSRLRELIGTTPVIYWEGDQWDNHGHKKPFTNQMIWWIRISEIVFVCSGQPMIDQFESAGAKKAIRTLNTYCHLKFGKYEKHYYPVSEDYNSADVSMIGNNLMSVPLVTGLPGSLRRFELAARLSKRRDLKFNLYGTGWPSGWSKGFLPYELQIQEIVKSKVNVNWDHFDKFQGYFSDRLPITLLSGTPHVTSFHQGLDLFPTEHFGLFQEKTPSLILERTDLILSRGITYLKEIGENSRRWTMGRLSHREAARHIISIWDSKVRRPPEEPWGKI